MYGNISDQRMRYYRPRVMLARRISGCELHTMGVGMDPGNHHFRPRFVQVVDVWKDL